MTEQTQARPVIEDPGERASIIAEMASIGKPAPKPEPKPDEPAPVEATAEPAAEVTEPEAETVEAEPEKKPEAKPDPEMDRRLAEIQKAEKAAKQAAAAERAALAKERAEIEAAKKEAAQAAQEMASFKEALKRAKYDRVGLLKALGVTDEMLEEVANEVYAASKKGAEDPRYKEQSARAIREREHADRMAALEQKLEETQRRIEEREARMAAEAQAERHMSGVFKAARTTKDAPLLARLIAKDADKADRKLAQIALELANETGELPDAEDVITTYEKRRRAELEDDGVDVDAMLKTTTKPQSKIAGEKPSARTLGNDSSTSTPVPRSDLSEQEERERDLAELARLNRGADASARLG